MLARLNHRLRPGLERGFFKWLSYDRGMIVAGIITALGVVLDLGLVVQYVAGGLRLDVISHLGVFGLFLIIIGFQTFGFTLLAEMMRRLTK
jgi:hypothetical protein